MKKYKLLGVLFYIIWSNPTQVYSQDLTENSIHLTLGEAISRAQEQSFSYKVAINSFQRSAWSFALYRSSFYPHLVLDGTIPNYSRAIDKITLPSGEDAFVSQNQAFSSLQLGINQRVAWTGGALSVFSSLDRIDVFGQNKYHRYASTPFSISYFQEKVGYNEFKWLRKLEPLRFETADKKFILDMEHIAATAVSHYFALLITQTYRDLSRQNLHQSDTLYSIARERFKLGTVSQSELLQLRLNVLNAQQQATQDSIQYVLAKHQLIRFLVFPDQNNVTVELPDQLQFKELIFDETLEQAYEHGHQMLDFRMLQMEADQHVARAKAEYGLKFRIHANIGASNMAPTWGGLWHGLENQQQIMIGFSIPLLDWNYSKINRQRAEAQQAMVESQIQQDAMQMDQELALQVARWNLQQKQLALARESQEIATQNYALEVERFLRGGITLNDLNAAQNTKDQTAKAYVRALEEYWQVYFRLRQLTLYDFIGEMPIQFVRKISL